MKKTVMMKTLMNKIKKKLILPIKIFFIKYFSIYKNGK